MAVIKYTCPPQTPSGQGTFSDNLVGFQLVQGGGLTQGNFAFTIGSTDRSVRSFDSVVFSQPISLESLDISSVQKAAEIYERNFKIYPNFDQTVVTNFVNYGPLTKRISAAVTNIINYFPAAIEVSKYRSNLLTGNTAFNISYNSASTFTTFSLDVTTLRNPFSIDFSVYSTQNISSLDYEISEFRNLPETYVDYVLQYNNEFYQIISITPSLSVTAGTLTLSCKGNPFSGASSTSDYLVIRPNDTIVNEVYNINFDEVEELLLNRYILPKYTAVFKVPVEDDTGNIVISNQTVTWPLDGVWNLDIRTPAFEDYLVDLNEISENFDTYQTDLISRFYTTSSFQEFDTDDNKMDKVLKIYGRSFDETKKYIDAIGYVNSVNYNIGDDIPSGLLVNLAQTLGWNNSVSPLTTQGFFDSLYGTTSNDFPGYSDGITVNELNNQFYRNLIINSAYLYKSKGTRRAIDSLLKMIGAPEALVEFNENVYVADTNINLNRFYDIFSTVSGGTFQPTTPVYDPSNTYRFYGVTYTAFTSTTSYTDIDVTIGEYPIDSEGYPKPPINTNDFFFQKGEGWFEATPQHRSPEIVNRTTSVFTGQNFDVQTQLEPFTYGMKYLDRFQNFPYLGFGFSLTKEVDNKKAWGQGDSDYRTSLGGGFDTLYDVSDDRLVLNVKNVELFLNPAQALVYDVWYLSNTKDYPIPYTGLSAPYPQPGANDWTFIDPKPQVDTFQEFYETFWTNTINTRNRQYSSDGKTGGYPTLQSIFYKYLTMYQDVGIQNNNFTYQNMINYINEVGDYWIRLVEQFIPATTIWNTGTKFENSVFHRQKFIYRRQKGCNNVTEFSQGPSVVGQVFPVTNGAVKFVTQSFKAANFYNDFVTTYNQQLNIEDAQCTGTYNVTEINTFTLQLIFTYTDGSIYESTPQTLTINGVIDGVTAGELNGWITNTFFITWDTELSSNGIQWVPSFAGYEFTNLFKQIQYLTLVRNITIIGNCI